MTSQRVPVQLTMKSLSCFCDDKYALFKLGTLGFRSKSKLSVEDVYTDTDSDCEMGQDARCKAEIQRRFVNRDDNHLKNVAGPSSESTNRYNVANYILVEVPSKKNRVQTCWGHISSGRR